LNRAPLPLRLSAGGVDFAEITTSDCNSLCKTVKKRDVFAKNLQFSCKIRRFSPVST
jgi:hypothetical protein